MVNRPYLLVHSNALKAEPKCECKCFVGIDKGILNILRNCKHLFFNGRSSLDQVVEHFHSKPVPFDPDPNKFQSK